MRMRVSLALNNTYYNKRALFVDARHSPAGLGCTGREGVRKSLGTGPHDVDVVNVAENQLRILVLGDVLREERKKEMNVRMIRMLDGT